ncbi:dolichyl-phosphate beta-glucosyltransferase [Modestobacter versicolor]|uniref:dolichyl-phosphate beta-glucosyltransferase n=1 Tax=Modestobacter versicolor TaxID=429133 RepID=UPI0034DE63D0
MNSSVLDGSSASLTKPRPGAHADSKVLDVPHPRTQLRTSLDRARRAAHTSLDLVIPAYNEAGRLPATLQQVAGFLAEQSWTSRIVVVDNGSSDGTAEAARRIAMPDNVRMTVIGCARPGKGEALRRGILHSDASVVGFCDADLATPLTLVPSAMVLIQSGIGAVIGSRHLPDSRIATPQPARRRLGGSAFRGLARPLVPGVRDTQCGFKFFERELAQRAVRRCTSTGFAFDVDLLRSIRREGGSIAELPVEWSDAPGSTFNVLRHGLPTFSDVVRLYRKAA